MTASGRGGSPRSRLHWLVLTALVGTAVWCLIGAGLAAVVAGWGVAAVLVAAAVALLVVTAVLARPRREPADRPGGTATTVGAPSMSGPRRGG